MNNLELVSQLENISLEAVEAHQAMKNHYDSWAVGMSPQLANRLIKHVEEIEMHCRNVRELLK